MRRNLKKSVIDEILSKIDTNYVKEQAAKIKSKDFNKITDGAAKIIESVKNNRTLMRLIDDVKTLLSLVTDFARGNYREAPYKTIAAAAFTLLYILNPFDLMPDFIPGLGYIDDAAVIMLVVKYVGEDIEKYRAWKNTLLSNNNFISFGDERYN